MDRLPWSPDALRTSVLIAIFDASCCCLPRPAQAMPCARHRHPSVPTLLQSEHHLGRQGRHPPARRCRLRGLPNRHGELPASRREGEAAEASSGDPCCRRWDPVGSPLAAQESQRGRGVLRVLFAFYRPPVQLYICCTLSRCRLRAQLLSGGARRASAHCGVTTVDGQRCAKRCV